MLEKQQWWLVVEEEEDYDDVLDTKNKSKQKVFFSRYYWI